MSDASKKPRNLLGRKNLRLGSHFIALGLVIVVIMLSNITTFAGSDAGLVQTSLKVIRGYVKDFAGTPVQGANVTIQAIHEGNVLTTKYYDSTEVDGFYSVVFPNDSWYVGDVFEGTATFVLLIAENSVVADAGPMQYLNLTFSTEVPEFGGVLGSSVSFVVIGMIVAFVVVRRRRGG